MSFQVILCRSFHSTDLELQASPGLPECERRNRCGCGAACLSSHLFDWQTKPQHPETMALPNSSREVRLQQQHWSSKPLRRLKLGTTTSLSLQIFCQAQPHLRLAGSGDGQTNTTQSAGGSGRIHTLKQVRIWDRLSQLLFVWLADQNPKPRSGGTP